MEERVDVECDEPVDVDLSVEPLLVDVERTVRDELGVYDERDDDVAVVVRRVVVERFADDVDVPVDFSVLPDETVRVPDELSVDDERVYELCELPVAYRDDATVREPPVVEYPPDATERVALVLLPLAIALPRTPYEWLRAKVAP